MGNPRGRPKKKKIGYRGADGRAAPKKPKPAQQHELPPGAGDALSHERGADLMDVVDVNEEEGKTAAGEDVNDEDWCDEDPSGAHSRGRGQSILSFAQQSMVSAARAAGNAAKQIPPRVLSNSQKYRNRKKLFEKQAMGMARTMGTWMWRARQQQQQQQQQDETQAEKDAAAAKALAASQECRTFSARRAKRAFKKWNKKRAMAQEGEEEEAENAAS